jgi:hypothetical protein
MIAAKHTHIPDVEADVLLLLAGSYGRNSSSSRDGPLQFRFVDSQEERLPEKFDLPLGGLQDQGRRNSKSIVLRRIAFSIIALS